MVTKNFTFQYARSDRDLTKMVLKQNIRALCLNADGLEILHLDPTGARPDQESVHVVRGVNLELVWDDVAFNRLHHFAEDTLLSKEAWARVTNILKRGTFSKCERPMLADQNRARKDCLQFESGAFRHLLPLRRLEAFGMQGQRRLLLQFEGSHSYILTPLPGEYAQVRDRVLNENLDPGCLNQFTVFDGRSYAGTAPLRYVLESIEHQPANLAARGDWTIALDLRWSLNRARRPPLSISP